MTGKMLKPWPGDAVMIVASVAGLEKRDQMERVVLCNCRDCGRALHADSRTLRFARQLPCRKGRPIKFFCAACLLNYDRRSLDQLYDLRPAAANSPGPGANSN